MKISMMKMAAIGAIAAGMALAQTTTTATQPGAGKAAGIRGQIQRRMLKALDLTDTQKQQAKVIMQATKAQAQPLAQQLQQARQTLATAVQAGDEAKIQQTALEVGNLQGHVLAVRSAGRAKFLALLTPDQKAKAAEFQQKVKQVLGKGVGGD
jgi:Spy/CpxP family protein refolding chaperone